MCFVSHSMRCKENKPVSALYRHPHEQWGIGQGQGGVSSLCSHVLHVIDFWNYLRVFAWNVEAVTVQTWAKDLTCSLQFFRVSFGKDKSPQTGGISDFREQCFGFHFCSWGALLEKQHSAERWWTYFTLRVGEPLSKIAAWPHTRKDNLQNGQKLHLSCINTLVLEKGLQGLWWPPPLLAWDLGICSDLLLCPTLPVGCQLQFLMEELVERCFSTAGETTSSRRKLFWTLGNSFP